jgi:hypothetical protein
VGAETSSSDTGGSFERKRRNRNAREKTTALWTMMEDFARTSPKFLPLEMLSTPRKPHTVASRAKPAHWRPATPGSLARSLSCKSLQLTPRVLEP